MNDVYIIFSAIPYTVPSFTLSVLTQLWV